MPNDTPKLERYAPVATMMTTRTGRPGEWVRAKDADEAIAQLKAQLRLVADSFRAHTRWGDSPLPVEIQRAYQLAENP